MDTEEEAYETKEALQRKRAALEQELYEIENQVFSLELSYMGDTPGGGTALKGWGLFRSQGTKHPETTSKELLKEMKFPFSYSSATSAKNVGERYTSQVKR